MAFGKFPLKQNTKIATHTLSSLQEHMSCYGYQPLDTPIIERADLFLTRAGDQVINKLFTFTRRGQELVLRPEFTAIAAHYFVNHRQQSVARWQFSGAIFADDPNNIQHDYQQTSLGAELIGISGAAIDAEIIGLAVQGLEIINIVDYEVVIGHAGLTRQLLSQFDLDHHTEKFLLKNIDALRQPDLGKHYILEQFEYSLKGDSSSDLSVSDKLPDNAVAMEEAAANTQFMLQSLLDATRRSATMGGRTQHDITRRLLQKQRRSTETRQVQNALDFLEQWANIQATPSEAFDEIKQYVHNDPIATTQFLEWQQTINLLKLYGINPKDIIIQPYLSRNWEYYTGIVFELVSRDRVQLGSGGRYDELVALIGGDNNAPAVGFAYYFDNILNCIAPSSPGYASIFCVTLTEDNVEAATRLANRLRAQNLTVVLLPENLIESNHEIIKITTSGQITFGGQQFTLADIDTLIILIRQYDHVQ